MCCPLGVYRASNNHSALSLDFVGLLLLCLEIGAWTKVLQSCLGSATFRMVPLMDALPLRVFLLKNHAKIRVQYVDDCYFFILLE